MESVVLDIGLRLLLGGAIGFCIGLTGVGGGVLVMPALTVVMGFPPTIAVGTATAFSSLSKVYAIYEHWRLDNIAWRVGGRLLLGAVPSAILCTLFITEKAADPGFQRIQGWLVTGAIGLAAALMLLKVLRSNEGVPGDVADGDAAPEERSLLALVLGAAIGALIATTSVGGGVIVMPILVFAFPMTMRRVVGTAIFVALVVSTVSSGLYHFGGETSHVDFATAGWLVAGSLLGIRSGTRLTEKLDDRTLTVVAVGMIALAVVAMVAKMAF